MAEQEKDVNTGANTEERETDTSSGEPSGNEESSVAESVAEETSNTTQATDAPPHTKPPPTAEAEEPSTAESKSSPKVKWRVEYRQQANDSLLYTRDITDSADVKRQQKPHTGPVFEVIDVNYTAETKDTDKNVAELAEDGAAPSLSFTGRQFIRIHSPAVINAIQAVVNYYPRHPVIGKPIDIYEPYPILIHHREELEAFRQLFSPEVLEKADDAKDCVLQDTYEHVGCVLEFLEDRYGEKIRREKERWAQDVPKCSFDMLWLLLKPGSDVYCDLDDLETREPFVVSHLYMGMYNKAIFEYTVRGWHLSGDEYYIHPAEKTFDIFRFDGEKEIHKLDVFPCEYLKEHKERKVSLIERGKRFYELRQKKCMYFDGECSTFPRREYKGYVMVDPVQYATDFTVLRYDSSDIVDRKPSGTPYCLCKRCSSLETEATKPAKFDGYMRIDPDKGEGMTDHQYFICARDTNAFIFQVREWKRLFLDGFQDPKWDMGLIDNLVLKPHYKNMIQSLSKNFMEQKSTASVKRHDALDASKDADASQSWTADFIENKGKGLIFLLHGKPGVGKTYTAECIAEHVRRPLLPITCADIGVEPNEVEDRLVRWFKIARSWDAVMLLDEADIYMEYRQIHDLNRNNLVASFLRAIEYYEGILFLTTNRVGTFDEAFLSRINLAIYYPDFQDDERERIWHNYFDKLEREASNRFYVPEGTKDYATESDAVKDLKWNGREIRNAFQIAVNLAQAEGTKDKKGRYVVKRDHIKVTVELSKEFKNYMVSVHKKNESQRAQLMGYRYDAFNTPGGAKQEYY